MVLIKKGFNSIGHEWDVLIKCTRCESKWRECFVTVQEAEFYYKKYHKGQERCPNCLYAETQKDLDEIKAFHKGRY